MCEVSGSERKDVTQPEDVFRITVNEIVTCEWNTVVALSKRRGGGGGGHKLRSV